MKKLIAVGLLFGTIAGASGCRAITAVAPTGEAGKVYVSKITSYVFFNVNKVQTCNVAGLAVTNCQDMTVE